MLKSRISNRQTAVASLADLFSECSIYLKDNVWQAILVVVSLVLAFGFYATHYTYHIDMLVDDYYNDTVLIAAGRFSAPIISFLTNWMQFAPFWHTAMLCIILFFAGLIFAVLFKRVFSEIPSFATFSFWIVFATYPIISYQLTYPILSVVLPYALIGIAVWLMLPIFKGEKMSLSSMLLSVFLITVSVDMYESHAAVFLTTVSGVVFLHFMSEHRHRKLKFNEIFLIFLKAVLILAVAVILDFVISKIVCFISTGSFEFWYGKNTAVAWTEGSILKTVKWIVREYIGKYFIAGVSNLSILLYDIAIVGGGVLSVILFARKRSVWYIVLYVACVLASISLGVVIGSGPTYRMAQPVQLFVPFFVMLFVFFLPAKKQVFKMLVACVLGIIVINQTLSINRYSVVNYQRFQYENNILENIAEDLREYPIEKKAVLFISNEKFDFPHFESTPLSLENPIAEKIADIMYAVYDKVIPGTTFKRINERYGDKAGYSLLCSKNIDRFFNENYKITPYSPFNTRNSCPTFSVALYAPELYSAFSMLGLELIVSDIAMTADEKAYPAVEEEYKDMPAYPVEGYINETDDMIIVKVY